MKMNSNRSTVGTLQNVTLNSTAIRTLWYCLYKGGRQDGGERLEVFNNDYCDSEDIFL